jgi:adhesin transport system outer membrane protein
MRQQMALRAVQGWTEWYLGSLRLLAQEKSVQAHLRLMEVVKRRVSEGAMAPSELSLTQSRLDQTLAQAQTFSAQMRVAKLRLSQLIGRPLTDSEVPVPAAGPAQCDLGELQGKAIQVSAAVKKVMSQQDALGFELQERRAELSPELYIRLERQRSPTSFGDSSVTNNRLYLGLSSRLGAGLSNLTALQSLEKRRSALEAEAESAKLTVIETVQSEYEQLVSLENRLPLLRKALESTIQTAQAWDRQFLAGRRAWIEVMNAARETTQAEIEWGDANASQISTQWRLSIYCGQQEKLSETANLKVN